MHTHTNGDKKEVGKCNGSPKGYKKRKKKKREEARVMREEARVKSNGEILKSDKLDWIYILLSPFIVHVNSGKFLDSSVSQFPHLKKWD